mmetsp:Transcript_7541/g.6886  ORF Transcript_7541/g.6886 Transcript_7541/m.6886 type:complete len:86 (+) Transcript_7541:1871-2128(+)
MIRINLRDIKNNLTPNPKSCSNALKMMLPRMVRRRIDEQKDWIKEQIKAISFQPTNVATYVKQRQSLDYIDATYPGVKEKIDLNL